MANILMLFQQKREFSNDPDQETWVNTNNLFFPTAFEALEAYANIPCPASQLLLDVPEDQVAQEMNQMRKNFQDPVWLEEFYSTL